MRSPKRRANLVVLLGLAAALSSAPPAVFADQPTSSKPIVVVTKLTSPPDDPVAEQLASTITSSLQLVMRLVGNLKVERADFLVPNLAFGRALGYYHQVGADGAVYGSVRPEKNGDYSIELGLWNGTRSGNKPLIVRRTITDILSSFGVADRIALNAASTIVGRKLAEGTLVVKNTGDLSAYSVYADGHLLGRNRTTFHVLTGVRSVIVAKPGVLGDVPLQTFHVDIRKETTTTVTLTKKRAGSAVGNGSLPLVAGSLRAAASPRVHVYVVGEVDGDRPVLWENGQLVSLALPNGTAGGRAYAIGVDPSANLYVAGSRGPKDRAIPVYWRNGKEFDLPTGNLNTGRATSVAFDGKGNVYFGGSTGSATTYPTSWENGRVKVLPGQGIVTSGNTSGVAVNRKGDALFAGYIYYLSKSLSGMTAQYWSNGELENLQEPKFVTGTQPTGIAVDGRGNLFLSGNTLSSSQENSRGPIVWDNGWISDLPVPDGSTHTVTTAVAADEWGNVYVAGHDDATPLYWKNGQMYALPTGAGDPKGVATSVAVDTAGDFYIGGWIGKGQRAVPVYWDNGRMHLLPLGSEYHNGRAYGIMVVAARATEQAVSSGSPHRAGLEIEVKPRVSSPPTVKLSIYGPTGRFNAMGQGSQPYFIPAKPGHYAIAASFSDDPGVGYHGAAEVKRGILDRITIPLTYSPTFRLKTARDKRASLGTALHNLSIERRSKTVRGTVLEASAGVGGVLAGVFGFLAANQSSSTSSSGGLNAQSYEAMAIGSGIAGLVALVAGTATLHSRPPASTLTAMEEQIKSLDAQINRLNTDMASNK